MKRSVLLAATCTLLMFAGFSQNIGINTDASKPDKNAILDIKSGNKGLLIPRMDSVARKNIPTTKGLLVYDISTDNFWYNTGKEWKCIPNDKDRDDKGGDAWLLKGNSNTKDGVNFLGTTNNVPLNIRVNNQPSGRIDSDSANTFWGYLAGASGGTGTNNTGTGTFSLQANTGGYNNVANGFRTLFLNINGFGNTANGCGSMQGNEGGNENTANGSFSLGGNTIGFNNVATGAKSLYFNTTGFNNVADGYQALYSNTTVNNLTATGAQSLYSNSSGFNNVADGYQALYSNTTGIYNTAVGFQSLYSNIDGFENEASGTQALYTSAHGSSNTANGSWALFSNTTGSSNLANGARALYSNTTGFSNAANGSFSLYSNTTGNDNTGNGMNTLRSNTVGYSNTANGESSLYYNITGYNNTANGASALQYNTTGLQNTANGVLAMCFNTTGSNNTANGVNALVNNSIGTNNTANGAFTMQSTTSGIQNTGDGAFSLNTNITGSNNTAIGYQADVSRGDLSFATAIGAGAIVDASNKVRIGNSAVTVIEGQVPFTTPSDGRYKFNVREDVKGLNFILQLRPVTYQFDVKRFDANLNHKTRNDATSVNYALQAGYDEATRIRRTGFIAQEVEQAANASGYDFSGIIKPKTENDHYSLSYDAFVVPLVKAVQEQQQIIVLQNAKIKDQDKRLASLEQELTEIKNSLNINQTQNNNH